LLPKIQVEVSEHELGFCGELWVAERLCIADILAYELCGERVLAHVSGHAVFQTLGFPVIIAPC
jgi:hypothetical protein